MLLYVTWSSADVELDSDEEKNELIELEGVNTASDLTDRKSWHILLNHFTDKIREIDNFSELLTF